MDDFSFPTIVTNQDSSLCQLPFPHFAASPLWFLSSSVPPDDDDCQLRRSPSANAIDDAPGSDQAALLVSEDRKGLAGGCSDEDKMDMLWEDFNEELRPRVSFELKRDTAGEAGGRRVSLFDCRRPSQLVMLLKMLKKLFLLQKTSS